MLFAHLHIVCLVACLSICLSSFMLRIRHVLFSCAVFWTFTISLSIYPSIHRSVCCSIYLTHSLIPSAVFLCGSVSMVYKQSIPSFWLALCVVLLKMQALQQGGNLAWNATLSFTVNYTLLFNIAKYLLDVSHS